MEKTWVVAHSAKGTTWANHKYFKKVGNRYYYSEDIKSARNKMKAADQFNVKAKKINDRYDGMVNNGNIPADQANKARSMELKSAKNEYDQAVSDENRYKEYENNLRTTTSKITLGALNAKEAVAEYANKGKKLLSKLLKRS